MSVFYKHPLPLPLGEVDERSEDGEGKLECNALSVAYGDSSPKGRAKELLQIALPQKNAPERHCRSGALLIPR